MFIWGRKFTINSRIKMASKKKFSQFVSNTTPALTDEVVGLQSGANKRTTLERVRTLLAESGTNQNEILVDNNANSSVLTDYQVKFTLTYIDGMNSDFSDVRFYDYYGATSLPYWIQSKTDGASAEVWVKIPYIPASSTTKILLKYGGGPAVESESNGFTTFPDGFDDFVTTNSHHQMAFGSDGGWCSKFCPPLRRMYFFGTGSDTLANYGVTTWVNIDTWEVGSVMPPFPYNSAGVEWHDDEEVFYLYGGANGSTSVILNTVYKFNPVTEVFTLLPVTLPEALFNPCPFFYPANSGVFIVGGRKTVGPNTFTDKIYFHNTTAGTITDTGARLFSGSDGMSPTLAGDGKAYFFGGAYLSAGNTVDTANIYRYDPANPSVNPVDTGTDMAIPLNTTGAFCVGENIYVAGGYSYTNTAYTAIIQKYNVTNNTISTLDTGLPHADDDMIGFYDSVTEMGYFGPVLHSNAGSNADNEKIVVVQIDPTNDFVYPQTPFGSTPSGWTNTSTATIPPRNVGNTYCTFCDYVNTSALSMRRTFQALSGIKRIDMKVAVSGIDTGSNDFNAQAYVSESDVIGTTALTKSIIQIRNDSLNWMIGSNIIYQTQSGFHVVSAIMNFTTQQNYGEVDYAHRVGPYAFLTVLGSRTINSIFLTTGTSMVGNYLFDWVMVRNSTLGTEPTITVL